MIVVATTPGREDWLNNFLNSLYGYDTYPLIVLSDYTFELGKIRFLVEHTDLPEFFFLQDSCEIKKPDLFDLVFQTPGSVALSSCPVPFGMYLGKYRREILSQMIIPQPRTKLESIEYEVSFNREYVARDPSTTVLFPDFVDGSVFEEKFGRKNMVLENDYLKKYKSVWTKEMAQ